MQLKKNIFGQIKWHLKSSIKNRKKIQLLRPIGKISEMHRITVRPDTAKIQNLCCYSTNSRDALDIQLTGYQAGYFGLLISGR
jgi:hypothetical protein